MQQQLPGFLFALFILISLVVLSGLGVVYAKFETRKRFVEWQGLRAEHDALQVKWGQLQLEKSTLATHNRIENLARKHLKMAPPATGAVVILSLPQTDFQPIQSAPIQP